MRLVSHLIHDEGVGLEADRRTPQEDGTRLGTLIQGIEHSVLRLTVISLIPPFLALLIEAPLIEAPLEDLDGVYCDLQLDSKTRTAPTRSRSALRYARERAR
jgi:hypothetical protein